MPYLNDENEIKSWKLIESIKGLSVVDVGLFELPPEVVVLILHSSNNSMMT